MKRLKITKPIPEKHADKAMEIICTFFRENKEPLQISSRYLTAHGFPCDVDVENVLLYLESKGLIKYGADRNSGIKMIQITQEGFHYIEDRRDIKIEKSIESRRYFITTSIAVAALIIATAALIWQIIEVLILQ